MAEGNREPYRLSSPDKSIARAEDIYRGVAAACALHSSCIQNQCTRTPRGIVRAEIEVHT